MAGDPPAPLAAKQPAQPPDAEIFPEKLTTPTWSETGNWGRVHRFRRATFDLAKDSTAHSQEFEKNQNRGLCIYCDELTFTGKLNANGELVLSDLPLPWKSLKYIHIYARNFLQNVQGLKAITIVNIENLSIRLFTDALPAGLVFAARTTTTTTTPAAGLVNDKTWELYQGFNACPILAKGQKCPNSHAALGAGEAGWIFIKAGKAFDCTNVVSVAPGELSSLSIEDLLAYKQWGEQSKMLPKLLQLIFVDASAETFKADPPVATIISRLRFIIRCTKDSIDESALASDAKALLERIEGPFEYPDSSDSKAKVCFYAPVISVGSCMEYYKDRLEDAEKLENQATQLGDVSKIIQMSQSNMETLISELAKNSNGFLDVTGAEGDAKKALIDLDLKVRDMASYQDATKKAQRKFEAGLDAFKKDQEKKFVLEICKLAGEVAVGVIATVATCGAAAPVASAAIAEKAAEVAKKGTKLVKLWEVLKKLGEIGKEVGPKLYDAYQKQSSFSVLGMEPDAKEKLDRAQAWKNSVDDMAKKITSDGLPSDKVKTTDFLGMLATWQEYEAQIEVTFETMSQALENQFVDGMADYKLALKNQVIRGKTVLSAMKVQQDTTQLFLRQTAELQARKKREGELRDVASTIGKKAGDDIRFRNEARLAYQRRLVKVRRGVYLALHEAALAYLYTAGAADFPTGLRNTTNNASESTVRGDLTAAGFRALYEEFKKDVKAVTTKEANRQVTSTPAHVDTLTNVDTVFDPNWKTLAVANGLVTFTIPLRLYEGYYRVRVISLKIDATVADKKINGIEYSALFGPLMIDRNSLRQNVKFYSGQRLLKGVTGNEASWQNELLTYARPTVFSEMIITFAPASLVLLIPPGPAAPVPKVPAPTTPVTAPVPVPAGSAAAAPVPKVKPVFEPSATGIIDEKSRATAIAIARIQKLDFTLVCEGIAL